jgi:hypothetical protein
MGLVNEWYLATVRVCADGGANRLFDFLRNDEQLREKYVGFSFNLIFYILTLGAVA